MLEFAAQKAFIVLHFPVPHFFYFCIYCPPFFFLAFLFVAINLLMICYTTRCKLQELSLLQMIEIEHKNLSCS